MLTISTPADLADLITRQFPFAVLTTLAITLLV